MSAAAIIQVLMLYSIWNKKKPEYGISCSGQILRKNYLLSVVMGAGLEAFRASFLSGINTATLAGSLLVCVIVGILFSGLLSRAGFMLGISEITTLFTGSAANYLPDSGNPFKRMMTDLLKTPCWTVYMLRNERNALYTGILTLHGGSASIDTRAQKARFTRTCKNLELVYHCDIGAHGAALTVEAKIKRLGKDRKEAIVAAGLKKNDLYDFLSLP
ncbi:MAG: hypothetical protein R2874_14910 [Desulfobacterales bacterium]